MKFRRVNVLLVELIAEAVRQRPKLFDVKLGNQCTGSILYFPYFSISFLISPRSLNFYKKFRKFESKPRAEVYLAKLHPNSHNLCNSSRSIWILKLQDKRSPIHSTNIPRTLKDTKIASSPVKTRIFQEFKSYLLLARIVSSKMQIHPPQNTVAFCNKETNIKNRSGTSQNMFQ